RRQSHGNGGPAGRERDQYDEADRAEPFGEARVGTESHRERHADDGRDGDQAAEQGLDDMSAQYGTAGDIHHLEPVDDPLRHIGVDRAFSSVLAWPVRARKTSSRSGVWTEKSSTSTECSSSWLSRARTDFAPPSLETRTVRSSSSSRVAPGRSRSAVSASRSP